MGADAACQHCFGRPLPYARCHAPYLYEFPFDALIPALKYEGVLAHARVLGTLLAERIAERDLQRGIDVLVPMPLHVTRLVERGFNQALELARFTGASLTIPIESRALSRTRPTTMQVGLTRTARMGNVRGAFAARTESVARRTVALLDDVLTTGSTVNEAAAALLAAGASRVEVWCVARALG
jgi:ComF family protein